MSSLLDVNPTVRNIRVSNSLQAHAEHVTQLLAQGAQKPFKKVIDARSGDPHGAGIAPITFIRQVLAACLYPELLRDESLPQDVRVRAQTLLQACTGGSVGSYSEPCGLPLVQQRIAEYISRRDSGVTSHPDDIIIFHGHEWALSAVLHLMASGVGATRTGVLTPVPSPHTLHMLLDEAMVTVVPYQLVEEQGWSVDLEELQRALETARGRCRPRALYICNPGNPTGHVQDRTSIERVIGFAARERLVLLVDEVHQDSVHGQDTHFVSYKKVLAETSHKCQVELVSFHSASSALTGECGLRGGYMEIINMDPAVKVYVRNMYLSPSVIPQLAMEVMVNPPTPGDPSYDLYSQELSALHKTLTLNAQQASETLNRLTGMSCQPATGGIFLYARLNLPPELIEEAEAADVRADVFYCRRLLEQEGVCLGAGCENGQDDKQNYVRLCVLLPPAVLDELLTRLRFFHLNLLGRFVSE